MNVQPQDAVWQKHAAQWQRVGAPLKPCPEDGRHMLELLSPVHRSRPQVNIGMLGVTPELVQLPWPASTHLHAFDHSQAMIEAVWTPNPAIPCTVTLSEWQRIPRDDHSLDAVIGDNSLGVLPDLASYRAVLSRIHELLREDGLMCLRFFIRPSDSEALGAIADDALRGKIGSFHALKWRIAMSLSQEPAFSVAVADIHAAFEAMFPDRQALAAAGDWERDTIDTIDAYLGAPTRFTFLTLDALTATCSDFFRLDSVRYGSYELSERCPTISLQPV